MALELSSSKWRLAKTDRVDAERLLTLLQRWYGGAAAALRVPSVEDEDGRVLHRERASWVEARKQVGNRLRGVLAAQGVRTEGSVAVWGKRLGELRTGDGRALPPQLRERVERLVAYRLQLDETIRGMEAAQRERIRAAAGQGTMALVEMLMRLRGVGQQGAWLKERCVRRDRHLPVGASTARDRGIETLPRTRMPRSRAAFVPTRAGRRRGL